jgi:hypothetical protein
MKKRDGGTKLSVEGKCEMAISNGKAAACTLAGIVKLKPRRVDECLVLGDISRCSGGEH